MNIHNRIKKRRIQLGLTLIEVANKLGVSEGTVQRYESGFIKNIKYETIVKLSEILNCTPEYLMGFSDVPEENELLLSKTENRRIKVFGKICAGNGKTAYEDIIDEIYCPYPNLTGNLIALKVDGNSMDKVVKDGDYAIIRIQPTVENGSIAAIIIDNNDGMLKRFYRLDHETVVLKPESTDESYKPIIFTKEEINKIRIIGKFVGYVSPYLGDC